MYIYIYQEIHGSTIVLGYGWLGPIKVTATTNFCHLLIRFPNSLDPGQARQNVVQHLYSTCDLDDIPERIF